MSNELRVFENSQFGPVRTMLKDGDPWFVAADVCRALEIANNRDALARLDEDENGVASTDTLGGKQEMSIVNEPGLYSLALGSRKPEARAFKRWITHDILPTLRRTGIYAINSNPSAAPGALRTYMYNGVECTTLKDLADFMGVKKYCVQDAFRLYIKYEYPSEYFALPMAEARKCYHDNGYRGYAGPENFVIYFITRKCCHAIAQRRGFNPELIDRAWIEPNVRELPTQGLDLCAAYVPRSEPPTR